MAANPDTDLRDGRVLNMSLISDHSMSSLYTIPISIGPPDSAATFNVQVDTGSADLWVAAEGCTTGCKDIPSGSLYRRGSDTRETGRNFSIQYAIGSASGPVYWEDVTIGPYHIGSQAFAAVTEIHDEAVSDKFVGVLGLAMTEDSKIAQVIPVSPGGAGEIPDGQTFASNLWGITPVTQAPSNRFLSFLLERPDMPLDDLYIPSQLGIGAHPTFLNSYLPSMKTSLQASLDVYTTPVVPLPSGINPFWRTSLTFMVAHTAEGDQSIPLPAGRNGNYPTVIFDTGGSTILTTREFANRIYGAYGVGPGSDGNYYVPCRTPLNFTMVFASLPAIPIHPLDLSVPTNDPSTCQGLIQAHDALSGVGSPAEFILGVPFLRNVYMVLWRDGAPTAPSIFPTSTRPGNPIPTARAAMSLIPLTNISLALQQFNQIRILKTPLGGNTGNSPDTSVKVGSRLSLGIVILLAFVGLAVVVGALFGIWWFTQRRKLRQKMQLDPMGLTAASGYGLGFKANSSSREEKEFLDGARSRPRIGRVHSGAGSGTTNSDGTLVWTSSYSGDEGEFGEYNRGRKIAKDLAPASANSRSVSGYFREPEPWEIAGSDGSRSGRSSALVLDGPTLNSAARFNTHTPEPEASEFPFPRHTRTPSDLLELSRDSGQEITIDNPELLKNRTIPSPSVPLLSDRPPSAEPESPHPPLIADGRYPVPRPPGTPPSLPRRGTASSSLGAIDLFGPPSLGSRVYSDERYPYPVMTPQHRPPHGSGSAGYFQYDDDRPRERRGSSASARLLLDSTPPGLSSSPTPMPSTSSATLPSTSSSAYFQTRERALSAPSREPELPPIEDESGATTPVHRHTVAGVGAGGRDLLLDRDLMQFNAGLRTAHSSSAVAFNNPATNVGFTYPPSSISEFGVVKGPEPSPAKEGSSSKDPNS